jgi:hypothetical protein
MVVEGVESRALRGGEHNVGHYSIGLLAKDNSDLNTLVEQPSTPRRK